MEDIGNKFKNTAKMLGAGGREALEFGDACWVIRHNINKELQAKARQTILNTELLGRKFGAWLSDMHSQAKSVSTKANKTLPLDEQINLMTLQETNESFGLGIVQEVLSSLITKQFHDSRL
jgi:hypothetical protein